MLEENSYQVTAWQLPERESPTRDKDWSLLNQTSKMYPHESSRWVCGESCESLQLIPWSDREPHVGFDMAKMMFLWSENDNEIYNAAFSHFGLSSPLQGVLFLHYSATYIKIELIIKRTKKKSHLVSQTNSFFCQILREKHPASLQSLQWYTRSTQTQTCICTNENWYSLAFWALNVYLPIVSVLQQITASFPTSIMRVYALSFSAFVATTFLVKIYKHWQNTSCNNSMG